MIRNVKGLVMLNWEKNGKLRWDLNQTIDAAQNADNALEAQGFNPAPTFRKGRQARNESYVKRWVLGCHFPWLNPR